MFNKNKNVTGMDLVIKLATEELNKHQPDSPEYEKIVTQLERLNKIAASNRRDKVSPNGLIAVIGNLAVTGLIIHHERFNVITTKAIGFVRPLSNLK
jgi:hypothetical protein